MAQTRPDALTADPRPTTTQVAQIAAGVLGGALLSLATVALAGALARHRAQPGAASDEERVRVAMGELCPHGWEARIMIRAHERGVATTSSESVELEWSELSGDGDEPAVVRRVAAGTIVDALDAMLEDRRTDAVLERIERAAYADDDPWDAL